LPQPFSFAQFGLHCQRVPVKGGRARPPGGCGGSAARCRGPFRRLPQLPGPQPPEGGAGKPERAPAATIDRREACPWHCRGGGWPAMEAPLLVRKGGLEPPRLAALEPKSRASTNSATFAWPAQAVIVAGRGRKRKACTKLNPSSRRHALRRFHQHAGKKKATWRTKWLSSGGLSRIRTLDLLIKSQLLYQLS
jgi:hypothetical protein